MMTPRMTPPSGSWALRALRALLVLGAVAVAVGSATAAEGKARPVLPGSIATLRASQASQATRDNQTMTAVLDARRAMLGHGGNESRSARPRPGLEDHDDTVGQGDGDGELGEELQPTATASAASAASDEDNGDPSDQGDEHRAQNHRVVDPTGNGDGRFSPSTELGPIPGEQYGFDGPMRHIHIHQHHLGATAGTPSGSGGGVRGGAGSSYSVPSGSGASTGRRPGASPAQSPGLSHYRATASSAPSAPTAPSGLALGHNLHSYKPVKFESEEQQQQQQYSVHEDQDHHHYHNQQAVHAAIAAAHPVAGEATGELAVGVGLGAGLAEGLHGLGAGAGAGEGLQYPLLGAAPYEPPKALPHAAEPLTFSHKPKEVKKGKSANLWKSALRVVASLAPLALLVAAIQPNILIVDPRLGNTIRQRSTEGHGHGQGPQRCEQRAVCEVAKAAGPPGLRTLQNSMPRSRTQVIELSAIIKAVESDACGQFLCDEYDARANLTNVTAESAPADILVTPGPLSVATTPMAVEAVVGHPVRRNKSKRKKVVTTTTAAAPPS